MSKDDAELDLLWEEFVIPPVGLTPFSQCPTCGHGIAAHWMYIAKCTRCDCLGALVPAEKEAK